MSDRKARKVIMETLRRAAMRARETPEDVVRRRAITNAQQKALRDADPERFAAYRRKARTKDLEKARARGRANGKAAYAADPKKFNARCKAAREANPEKYYAIQRKRYVANPAMWMALAAKRRAVQLRATPAWSESEAIAAFYAACPPNAHVDHWLPLQSKTVCGLHVLANLQYLTVHENKSKGNKMPQDTLPPFVPSKWIKLMLARFYASREAQHELDIAA